MKVYIDIDGVLLTKSSEVPDYGKEFIHFLTNNFDCYWLTTHCRGGENRAVEYLSRYYDKETLNILTSIQPTDWMDKKTEGIDYSSEFIWLEDNPFEAEKMDLIEFDCPHSLLIVDLNRPDELRNLELKLKSLNKLKTD